MVEAVCPEVPSATSPAWTAARLPRLRRLIALGDPPGPAWLRWADLEAGPVLDDLAGRERLIGPREIYNIQFTSGTTGLPKGAMLTHHNVLMNAHAIGRARPLRPRRPRLRPGPVLSLFRVRARDARLRRLRLDAGRAGAELRPEGDADRRRGRAVHRAVRCADDVRGRARPPRPAPFRPVEPPDRDHGGEPMPAPADGGGRAHAGGRANDDRLRPDRGLADHHHDLRRRPDRGPGRDHRAATPRRRGPARRPGHSPRGRRPASPASSSPGATA